MDRMEQKILERIDQNREKIIAFARDIYDHAELGYKEYRLSLIHIFSGIGLCWARRPQKERPHAGGRSFW